MDKEKKLKDWSFGPQNLDQKTYLYNFLQLHSILKFMHTD